MYLTNEVLKLMRAFSPLSKPVIHRSLMGPRILPLTPLSRDQSSFYIDFAESEKESLTFFLIKLVLIGHR